MTYLISDFSYRAIIVEIRALNVIIGYLINALGTFILFTKFNRAQELKLYVIKAAGNELLGLMVHPLIDKMAALAFFENSTKMHTTTLYHNCLKKKLAWGTG